ncbi:MAG TPA: glycosyltransferase family 4 protein [Sphingomicrobium sp.]|nr:glycosyltransferase family 4 protein [Sphingomicrobium sp.]
MTARVLYITYDGLTDPLGQSQVLPYLAGLAAVGHRITVLSCEKPGRMAQDGNRMRRQCEAAGIGWTPLAYHKRPPILSSALDAAALQRAALRLHREQSFDIVHCRSYIPARAGLALKRRFGVKLLFDMRGFWPDEKVEGNNWPLANPLYRAVYRYFKRLESRLLRGADHIVSLTEAGKAQLLTRPELAHDPAQITVIPCCVDFDHFPLATAERRKSARDRLAIPADAHVLAYLGSLGAWYMLDEMLDFFKLYQSRHDAARFLFVTPDEPHAIRLVAAARGIDPDRLLIAAATRDEVPGLLAAADLGIFFIRPVFSKTASSPTKMGEMLAVGLPILANAGVGDVEAMVEDMECGVAVRDFTSEGYTEALGRLGSLDGSPDERRRKALPWFDVKLGIERYDRVYRSLLG